MNKIGVDQITADIGTISRLPGLGGKKNFFLWVWPEHSPEEVSLQKASEGLCTGRKPLWAPGEPGRKRWNHRHAAGPGFLHEIGGSKFRFSHLEITKPDPSLRNRLSRNSNILYSISSKSTCSRELWFSLIGGHDFSI